MTMMLMLINVLSEMKMLNENSARLNQLITFFNTITSVKNWDLNYLKIVFDRSAEGFNETLIFLKNFFLVDIEDSLLTCSPQFINFLGHYSKSTDKEVDAKNYLYELILDNTKPGSIPFQKYLGKFHLVENRLIYSPTIKENLRFSGIRNLLMDLGIVILSEKYKFYQLENSFINQIDKTSSLINPETFRKIQKLHEEIGLKAEIWVLDDERKRLSNHPYLKEKISHISLKSINAGYDILSYDFESFEIPTIRYIEVKAVNFEYPHFYWSINEIRKAELYDNHYWLYLVYYDNSKEFNVINVDRLNSPYKYLFQESNKWNKQIEKYLFTKKMKPE